MALNRAQILARTAKVDLSDLTTTMQREDQLMRQAKMDRQADVEKLSAGLEFPGDFNEWDDPIVKGFVEEQVGLIGEYVNENPDLQYNMGKLVKFNQMKKNLMSNPAVAKAKRVGTEYDAMKKYFGNANNAHWVGSKQYEREQAKWENYRKYGDIDGEGGEGGEFVFNAPSKRVSASEIGMNRGKNLAMDLMRSHGTDLWRSSVSMQSIEDAARGVLYEESEDGFAWNSELNELVEAGKIEDTEEAKIAYAAKNWIKPYAKSSYMNKPKYQTGGSGSDEEAPRNSPYTENIEWQVPPAKENLPAFQDNYNEANKTLRMPEGGYVKMPNGSMFYVNGSEGYDFEVLDAGNVNIEAFVTTDEVEVYNKEMEAQAEAQGLHFEPLTKLQYQEEVWNKQQVGDKTIAVPYRIKINLNEINDIAWNADSNPLKEMLTSLGTYDDGSGANYIDDQFLNSMFGEFFNQKDYEDPSDILVNKNVKADERSKEKPVAIRETKEGYIMELTMYDTHKHSPQVRDMYDQNYYSKNNVGSSVKDKSSEVKRLPRVGEVVKGYVYLGGNPEDTKSWAPANQ